MQKTVVELSAEEKALLTKHLEGMSVLYVVVNGSGDGPLTELIQKIKSSQRPIDLEPYEIDRLLRHLKGAGKYDEVVYGNEALRVLLEKIEPARYGTVRV